MSAYQPDPTDTSNNLLEGELFFLPPENIASTIRPASTAIPYYVVNGNLILASDMAITPVSNDRPFPVSANNEVLRLPAPIEPRLLNPRIILSTSNQPFVVFMREDGRVFITGEFIDAGETLFVELYPYIAKTPFEFANP